MLFVNHRLSIACGQKKKNPSNLISEAIPLFGMAEPKSRIRGQGSDRWGSLNRGHLVDEPRISDSFRLVPRATFRRDKDTHRDKGRVQAQPSSQQDDNRR
jgi:hypothetical protein